MRLIVPLLLIASLLLACSDDEDEPAATPTTGATATVDATTPSTSPTAAPDASPSPAASATAPPPVSEAVIDATNFAGLDVVYQTVVETPQFMAWQDDGKLVVASRDSVSLIDPVTGENTPVYSGAGQEMVLAVSAQGSIVTAEAGSMGITVRDFAGAMVSEIQLQAPYGSVAFSKDGTRLAVSSLDRIAVGIWDVATGTQSDEVTGFQTAAPVYSALFGPDDASLVWVSRATVQATDLATDVLGPAMEHEDFVSSVYAADTGTSLVTTWGTFATPWDLQTGARAQDLDQGASAFQATLLPGATLLAVATDQGVNLWDLATFTQVATLDTPARQIAISDDGSYFATMDQDGRLGIWAATGS